MDFIKKTISIEGARTRTQGLMPYYKFGKEYRTVNATGCSDIYTLGLEIASGPNGNWGQFVANPCFLAESGKTYEAMLSKYYEMLNMVREGTKLRKVETKNEEIIFTEDIGAFYLDGQCFSGGTEPDYLYQYAAYDTEDFTAERIDSLREETKYIYRTDETIENDFVVLIKDYDKFSGLTNYLDGTDYSQVGTSIVIEGDDEHLKWARYCEVVDECIGKINVPSRIFNKHIKVPKSMPCADIEPYIDWLTKYQSLSADCCNTRLWDDMGGEDMLEFLQENKSVCEDKLNTLTSLDYAIPYIEMQLLLTQNYTDLGVLTNIDGVEYNSGLTGPSCDEDIETRPHGTLTLSESGLGFTSQEEIDRFVISGQGICIDQIMMDGDTNWFPTTEEYEKNPGDYSGVTKPIEVESLLQTLRNTKKYTDDKDNVLPGIFEKFSDSPAGQMFRCIKQGEEHYYRLVVVESSYTETHGQTTVTIHTLEYGYSEDSSLTKEDIPEGNFYEDAFPYVPAGAEFSEEQSDWQTLYNNKKAEMQGAIDNHEYPTLDPISVAPKEWRMEEIAYNVTDFLNGDGKPSEAVHYPESEVNNIQDKFYRTITTSAAGIRIAETEEEENGEDQPFMEHYYFMVKYDNSSGSPMTVPYSYGNTTNVYLVDEVNLIYRGDFIIDLNVGETTFDVKYVIGGYFKGNENGSFVDWPEDLRSYGDIYYEKYTIDKNHVDYVALDGVDNVPVWSEYIDFDGSAKEFYSPRYNLYRTGNTANIIRLTSGEFWTKKDGDENGYAYDAYLTKEDYLTNFSLPPKVDVNVTIDRGGVSAFEKHYKLSECNTMQDLVNHGNNFFNIE